MLKYMHFAKCRPPFIQTRKQSWEIYDSFFLTMTNLNYPRKN